MWQRLLGLTLDFLVPLGQVLRAAPTPRPFDRWRDVVVRALPQSFFGFWLFSFIPIVGGFIYMLGLVALQIMRHWREHETPSHERHYIALVYFTVILLGFGSIWSFVGHTFLADYVAMQIGWPTGSPFQTELAFYTLGTGVAALLAVWLRGHLITAVVLSKAIFLYGAGGIHLWDAIAHANFSPLNIGAPLIGDVIYPTLLLWLLWRSWGVLNGGRRAEA